MSHRLSFAGATPVEKPRVVGSWSDGSAASSLVGALDAIGIERDRAEFLRSLGLPVDLVGAPLLREMVRLGVLGDGTSD